MAPRGAARGREARERQGRRPEGPAHRDAPSPGGVGDPVTVALRRLLRSERLSGLQDVARTRESGSVVEVAPGAARPGHIR